MDFLIDNETLRLQIGADPDVPVEAGCGFDSHVETDFSHIEQRILAHLDDDGMLNITGEITCYFVDPRLYVAMVEGEAALSEWIEDYLQERIDEEGCGAVICAMTEWEDD